MVIFKMEGEDVHAATGYRSRRLKIIAFGPEEAGKSCIIKRYCEKRFVSKYLPTIGIDYGVTKYRVDGEDVKVDIFDLAGQPYFYEVRNEFYTGAHGALLAYDVNNRASFEALGSWLLEMRSHLTDPDQDMANLVVVVCANKVDLAKRKVDDYEGRIWAETRGYSYFETSALSGQGIQDMYEFLFSETARVALKGERPSKNPSQLGYTLEQASLVQRICSCRDSAEVLGVSRSSSKDDVLKAYKKLAVLLHPDKNLAPGSDEAFKVISRAKDELLRTK